MLLKRLAVAMLAVAMIIVVSGCPKKPETVQPNEADSQKKAEQDKAAAEAAQAQRLAEEAKVAERLKAEEAERAAAAAAAEKAAAERAAAAKAEEDAKAKAAASVKGPQPIYFDFNSAVVREDARSVIQENVEWLKAHPKAKVRIEGNCDERGTREYNQALGQRRAMSAKKYLTDMGIQANRIAVLSYGKEKPLCGEGTEECWQKNRRDDFVVISQ